MARQFIFSRLKRLFLEMGADRKATGYMYNERLCRTLDFINA
jgi:hypothetical protein